MSYFCGKQPFEHYLLCVVSYFGFIFWSVCAKKDNVGIPKVSMVIYLVAVVSSTLAVIHIHS